MELGTRRRFGMGLLVLGLIAELAGVLGPTMLLAIALGHAPRRYHYYYISPAQTRILVSFPAASLVFGATGLLVSATGIALLCARPNAGSGDAGKPDGVWRRLWLGIGRLTYVLLGAYLAVRMAPWPAGEGNVVSVTAYRPYSSVFIPSPAGVQQWSLVLIPGLVAASLLATLASTWCLRPFVRPACVLLLAAGIGTEWLLRSGFG